MKDFFRIATSEKNKSIPDILKKYFWDCNFDELNMNEHKFFIAERILRFGNIDSVKWLLQAIDTNFLKNIIQKSRNLDDKTKNFWQIMLYEK